MAAPEIGVLDVTLTTAGRSDPVFGKVPRVVPGLQWHEAEVVRAPPGATVLARNRCSPVQAFRVGARAYGIQFHVEVNGETIPTWARVPEYERTLAEHFGSPETLQRAVENQLGTMTQTAAAVVDALLDRAFGAYATP